MRGRTLVGGLELRHDGHGWDVVHVASGLKVAMDLRLRLHAEQARRDFLDTGVDFTKSRDEVQAQRRLWSKTYHLWWNRARRRTLDPETYEYYASYVPYGIRVPSARQAALMRQDLANVELFNRGELST